MDEKFQSELRDLIDQTDPKLRKKVRRDIKTLLNAGGNSIVSTVALLRNRPAELDLLMVACWLLGQLGDKRAVVPLVETIESQDARVAWEAAKSLGVIGSKRAVLPLIAVLSESGSVQKRSAAAYALGRLGDSRAIKPLLKVLSSKEEDSKLRGQVAEALANLGNRQAVPALIAALEDSSTEVRFWSVFALGQLGDRRAIPALNKLAATDRARLPGWGTIKQEIADAIDAISAGGLGQL